MTPATSAMNDSTRRLIIVTGLSGAGKTIVLHTLEDLSFYTVDNLPISLLHTFLEQITDLQSKLPKKVAVGIDARNSLDDLSVLGDIIRNYNKQNVDIELVFMDASNDVLTKRYSETRRKHPLTTNSQSLDGAIKREREIMTTFSDFADFRIDTSRMLLHELRDVVRERLARQEVRTMSLQIMSFGFKHGTPTDADFVFDLRCLPNPHWEKELRPCSGKDKPVVDFLSQQESVSKMLQDLVTFFYYWIPRFEEENRSYLSIALGCTGGHHRSVYLAEQLATKLRELNKQVIIRHRDI